MEYQFKIQIKGLSKPPVWRKVIVPAEFTFMDFHYVIQIAFGWEDCHLFQFKDKEYQGSLFIEAPSEEYFGFGAKPKDASKVKLSQVFGDKFRKLLYEYDFGDSWVHEITLEEISDGNRKEAVCIEAKGSCPPEDCGGRFGFENMKKIFQTMPNSDEANEYRDWLGLDEGETLNTETAFDLDKMNKALKEL